MKLIFCPHCQDVFKLGRKLKHCSCGFCKGLYTDSIHAETNGKGIALGIINRDLIDVMRGYGKKDFNYWSVRCFARPHEGPTNPNSTVNADL